MINRRLKTRRRYDPTFGWEVDGCQGLIRPFTIRFITVRHSWIEHWLASQSWVWRLVNLMNGRMKKRKQVVEDHRRQNRHQPGNPSRVLVSTVGSLLSSPVFLFFYQPSNQQSDLRSGIFSVNLLIIWLVNRRLTQPSVGEDFIVGETVGSLVDVS